MAAAVWNDSLERTLEVSRVCVASGYLGCPLLNTLAEQEK